MTGCLKIVDPGPMCTVQDLGRPGFRHLGVPLSGAADGFRLRLLNRLLGNPDGAAGLEFRLKGPIVTAVDAPLRVAVAGDAPADLSRRTADGVERIAIAPWRTITLEPGEFLDSGTLGSLATGYLGVAGGIDVAPVMGSRSTYARAGFGGFRGRPLKAGDPVPAGGAVPDGGERLLPRPPGIESGPLRVLFGPQDDHFSAESLDRFLSAPFTVSDRTDRMGARLDGAPLVHRPDKGPDILSDGLIPGAIQVPGDGRPIILGVDCQTLGGYAKIATVIAADLWRVGQLRPGDPVRFATVTEAEADRLRARVEARLDDLTNHFEGWVGDGLIDERALYAANLIDGVCDARDPTHVPGFLEGLDR